MNWLTFVNKLQKKQTYLNIFKVIINYNYILLLNSSKNKIIHFYTTLRTTALLRAAQLRDSIQQHRAKIYWRKLGIYTYK